MQPSKLALVSLPGGGWLSWKTRALSQSSWRGSAGASRSQALCAVSAHRASLTGSHAAACATAALS